MILREEDPVKKKVMHSPGCSRRLRIDDAENDMPLAVEKYATKFLDEAVRSVSIVHASHVSIIAL